MEKCQQNIESGNTDKLAWLANQIFSAFPEEVSGLKIYVLDCGCIYNERVHSNAELDFQIGIYRDAGDGACEVYLKQRKEGKDAPLCEILVKFTFRPS